MSKFQGFFSKTSRGFLEVFWKEGSLERMEMQGTPGKVGVVLGCPVGFPRSQPEKGKQTNVRHTMAHVCLNPVCLSTLQPKTEWKLGPQAKPTRLPAETLIFHQQRARPHCQANTSKSVFCCTPPTHPETNNCAPRKEDHTNIYIYIYICIYIYIHVSIMPTPPSLSPSTSPHPRGDWAETH